ncbi:MAG: LpxD N-terminal domain-containing protein, partial [Terriglobales bacterium]
MTLADLAKALECELDGPPEAGAIVIRGMAGLGEAGPDEISFLTDTKLREQARSTRARALIAGYDLTGLEREPPLIWLRSRTPEVAAAAAIGLLRPTWRPAPGIHPTASVHPSAELGAGSHVGAFVAIGEGCRIGAGAVLHPHVVIYPGVEAGERLLAHAHAVIREGTRLGDDVILQPGVILGGDGFGFARRADGSYAKIPQAGRVEIGDRV